MIESRRKKITFRVISIEHTTTTGVPHLVVPIDWLFATDDAAEDKINSLIAITLNIMSAENKLSVVNENGRYTAEISVLENEISRVRTRYAIHPIEEGICYGKNSQPKSYWEYRDFRIYPNDKGNRYKILKDGQYMYTRHSLEKSLRIIDETLLHIQHINGEV